MTQNMIKATNNVLYEYFNVYLTVNST